MSTFGKKTILLLCSTIYWILGVWGIRKSGLGLAGLYPLEPIAIEVHGKHACDDRFGKLLVLHKHSKRDNDCWRQSSLHFFSSVDKTMPRHHQGAENITPK